MAASSFPFDTSLDEWRHSLRDINFWLNGYLSTRAYSDLGSETYGYYVQWNVGVEPTASFTRAVSSIGREQRLRHSGPYDTVIEVDMKQAARQLGGLDIKEHLTIKVAEELGLLGQEYNRYKEEDNELRYYSYGMQAHTVSLRKPLESLSPQIIQLLSTKKYLLVVENLNEPIEHDDFTTEVFLPPTAWKKSDWLISTTSKYVYDKSKPPPDKEYTIGSFTGENILMLTLHSLHQAAKHISKVVRHEDEQYWHHVAIRCFHYATMLLIPYCSSARADGYQQSSSAPAYIASDELIRQWAAQGLITVIQERAGEVTSAICQGNYNDIYQVGNVVLEAFREYSLLQLPISPATQADETSKSAAYFLAYHGLIAESHAAYDEILEGSNHSGLEHMQWISHVANQGWHVSREWLSQGARGPTILIIRHCSKQSRLFMKLESDHLLAKLPYLRVLDLSYTPLESLPPSICSLQKLQSLSLRGCYNLRSPFCFPDTGITASENNSNKNLNFLFLDLSYSNINKFQCDFFHNTPSLKELLLVKCSKLEELPPFNATLSSLTKLELIDNKKFSSFSGLTEIALDGHVTLSSFSLVGTAHIKRLSLRGCRKLESVNIKAVDALEELDLSATAIKEIPDSIPNAPQLRRLLFIGVPFLRRFPWHKLQRFPDVFCLDQFLDMTMNHHSNPHVAQVHISDTRLFYSFNENTRYLVRTRQVLKYFYIRATSFKATARKQVHHDKEDTLTTNKLQISVQVYAGVNHHYLTDGVSMVSMDDIPPCRETERHVEISTVDRYPHGLKYLLHVTKSISMSDDTHVSCLSDLSSFFSELEECKLRRCHQMVHVFLDVHIRDDDGEQWSLKNVYVSHLKSLTHFCRDRYGATNFLALKHLHLEHCPRLEGVIPRASQLPSLVTLHILFCYNLKAIFYDDDDYYYCSAYYDLPCLRRIRLQELPLLEHLHIDDPILTAPEWEELHVRGCWSLRRLPRLRRQPDKAAVKVSGERAWWAKLRWSYGEEAHHRGSYEPRLPPASASIRERVVISTSSDEGREE